MQKGNIDKLLDTHPQLWRGRRANHRQATLSTGHARLDARLPGKGWPVGAVTELLTGQPGLGELSLLVPALSAVAERGQWVVMVDPPWIPYPAALHGRGLPLERLLMVRTRNEKESLWACEQAMRSGRGGAVLAWPQRVSFPRLRRLQLAAQEQSRLGFLFRPEQVMNDASPAALRLRLEPGENHETRIHVLKCRGARPPEPFTLRQPFSAYANIPYQNAGHEPCIRPRPLLAGHPPAAPRAGPAHPRTQRQGDGRGGEQDSAAPRKDH